MKQIILLALISSACIAVAVATEIGMSEPAGERIALHDIMTAAMADAAMPPGLAIILPEQEKKQ